MVISDLSYLEVVSEAPSVMGGATRVNKIKVKQTAVTLGSGTIGQSVSVVSSNDNL